MKRLLQKLSIWLFRKAYGLDKVSNIYRKENNI